MAATIDATATSPGKKRKRQDSHGSLADTEDIGIDYTRDSHDIVVTKSRRYTKKNTFMNSLGLNKSAKASDLDTDGASGDNKKKDKEMPTAPGLSKYGSDVNGSSDVGTDGAGDGKKKKKKKKQRERDGEMSTGSSQTKDGGVVNGSSEDLLLSPSKSGSLLRRKYRRERTSSQSSTDPGTASSLTDYFPPSGEVKVTEEEKSRLASEQNSQTHSDTWSSLIPHSGSCQARNKESQPPILLGPDGLLLEDDGFKKPLHPVPSSPSKYSGSLETGSRRKKERKKRKKNVSDDTSGIDTDTGASVSTVQSEDDEEKRHKKKKKKKKDRNVESNTLEGQDTGDLAVQSASEDVEGGKEKRYKKKKKKGKDRDEECNASEVQGTSGSMLQSGTEGEGAEEKCKKKKKKKDKERDIESNTSKEQGTSISTFHSGNEGGTDDRKHKKKKKKKDREKDSNTSAAQTTETEGSDVFPLAQKSPKGDKPRKKHKKGNEGSAVDSDSQVNSQEILSQNSRANGAASSETGTDSDMVSKKKKKSKKKRAESTGTSESEVPESDVGSPVKSPLPLPRTVTVREGGRTETVAKNKPTSTANKLPSWCIEDAGQESQTVSEVFDLFGWGQNKVSSSGSKLPSEGMIRTTSTQPNFDSVVDLGRGANTECGEKDSVLDNQPQDEGIVPPTPTKRKNKLSRKGKEKSDKSKAMCDGKEQESVVENDNVDVVEYSAWIENEGRQADKEGPEKDVALNNSSKDEGSSAVVTRSKRTLSRKEKQKSANSKNNGEKQGEGTVEEGTVSNGGGTQNEPASSNGLGESQLEENTANVTVSVDISSGTVPQKTSKDNALDNSSKDEGSSSVVTKSKRKLSRKEKQKSDNSKAINIGEVRQQANVTDSVDTTGTVSQKSAKVNRVKGTNRGKASNVLEGKESAEKEPAAKKNTTKKGTKKVKEGIALEEEESTMVKGPAVKRRRTKSKANQQDNLNQESITEEVKEEETQETVTEENVVEDCGEEHPEDHSSGEDFQTDIAAVPATGRKQAVRISHPRKAKETQRNRAATVSDPEVLWLKGMKALTAEDKEWLKEKGIKVVMGHYSTKEKAILKKNMESFCELYGVADPRTLLYPTQYEDKENLKKLIKEGGLFRHLAQGLNRPLWNVYTKARQMYFNPEMEGSFSKQEDKRLLQLVKQHGCRWAAISLIMGRFEDHLKHRWRRLNRIDQGHWSAEEDRKLVKAVRRVTGRKDIRNIYSGVNWANVAIEMDNKRSDKQCREHWRVLLNTLFVGEGTKRIWNLKRDAKLIDEIYRSEAEVTYDIDWEAITENLPWVHHPGVASKRWTALKTRVPDRNKKDMDEILDYLKEDLKKKIEVQKTKREEKPILELKSEPYVRTSDEEDSDDDDDDVMSDDDTDDDVPNADDDTGSNPDHDNPTPSAEEESYDGEEADVSPDKE